MFVLAWNLIRSPTGRAFMAIRDSETAATASGVSITYYKTLAFGISAAYSGVAGSLLAIIVAYINPDVFGLNLSLALLVGVVVGGVGSEFGPVIGGVFVVWVPNLAERMGNLHIGLFHMPSKPDIFFGILLLAIIFFAPSGAMGLIMRGVGIYRARRAAARGEKLVIAPVAGALEEATAREEPSEIEN